MAGEPILVVEDNPITRKMLCFALESEGYHVLEAGDGATAIRLAREHPPVLVLQDYVLPDMDGFSLIEVLRGLPHCATIPILVVTGMVSQLDELRARAGDLTTFLPKPIEPSRLIVVVRSLLAGRSAALGRGRRVLVVDDEPLNRKLAVLRLRDAGFEVETAASGEEALAKARSSPPEAIVSDVLMPGMDGFLLCRAVRRDLRLAHIPVLLVSSSYAEEEDRRLAREMGASGLLLRTPDLAGVAEALAAGIEAREQPSVSPEGDVPALHKQRLEIQLEKQLARNEALLRQGAIQAAALSVVRGLASALARPFELPSVLADVLVHCLDAAGLSTGLLYLVSAERRLRLQAQAGVPGKVQADAAAAFGMPDVLRRIMENDRPVACSAGSEVPGEQGPAQLAARLGHDSALVVPFVGDREPLGVLILASSSHDLSEPGWMGFARALAAQFGQTIAVAESLSRGAASETRYRSLMEHANDAILLLTPEHRILEANRQAQTLLGRSRDQMEGRQYDELVAPEDRDDAAAHTRELLVSGSTRVRERLLLRPDGTAVPVEVSGSVVRVGDETLVLAILRDVTERKRAEAELRAAKERLQHVVSSSPAVLYTLRVEGDALWPDWVSANIKSIIGYAPDEVVGSEWWKERLHPDDRDRLLSQIPELLATGHVEREYRLRDKSGRFRWIRDEQKLLHDPLADSLEVVGSWWEITDRKQAELRMEESEEKYRLLFDDNPHPMLVYDPETLGFLAANAAAVRQYGYSEAEFLAMTAKDIRPPEDIPEFLALAASRPRPVTTERRARHLKKDGTIVDVEVASNPIRFEGRVARLVLVTDVTDKTKLEAQLVQAQKMEAVGRLAGGVAHDFNNLLGIITGYSELLLRDLGEVHPGARRAEEIRKAAERAATLTRQLLAFSRKQVLEPKLLDLNAVVADVDRMLRRLIGEDIQLITVLGAELDAVRADPGQIEQVLLNLAVNSRDAMPRGGKLILETSNTEIDSNYCRAHPDARPGPYVMLAVSDTGHGIDSETMTHIFEPFFTTKGEGKGTGLGLAMVFGIVKQSGGQIEVYSEVGQGTSFKLYLPRADRGSQPAAGPVVPANPPQTGTETVLLVEDAEALGLMVREILDEAGYVVLHASAPEQAMALAASHAGRIHLVLTDVVMPGMSGREMGARILRERPDVRILYMSGYTDEAIGQHGALDPGTHFIQKPFTADALLRKLRAVLDAGGIPT